ncbi:hypothetical protein BMR06_07375, partial [Methylococcaceae bacterium HT5]
MTEYEIRGGEIRGLAKTLVLQFMQNNHDYKPGKNGLKLAQIFRMCGFDWGEYEKATSSNQQYWIVALVRELEYEGK